MKARMVNNEMMKYEKPKLRLIDISKLRVASGACGGAIPILKTAATAGA